MDRIKYDDIDREYDTYNAYHPWRRFFARDIDMALYALISFTFFVLINPNQAYQVFHLRDRIDYVVSILLFLFLEPLWLMLWGTTPGKWIFGLRVTLQGEQKLSYSQGFRRTTKVCVYGLGLGIPIVYLITLFISYRRCKRQEDAPWDDEISYSMKDTRAYRGWLALGAFVLIVLLNIAVEKIEFIPPHRGEMNIKEFSENYNYYSRLYKINGRHILGSNGQYSKQEINGVGSFSIGYRPLPSITYKFSDGFISEIVMEASIEGIQEWIPTYNNELMCAALAFANSSETLGQSFKNIKKIQKEFKEPLVNNFMLTLGDVTINYDIQHEGYYDGGTYFIPREDEPKYNLRYRLTMVIN